MKKFIIMILLLVISINLAACAKKETPNGDINLEDSPNEQEDQLEEPDDTETDDPGKSPEEGQGDGSVETSPKTDSQKVVLYFANNEYIESGNEELDHVLPIEKTLNTSDISIEEAIVKELMKDPNEASMTTGIPSTVKLLGVEVVDGTAFVNFAQEGLSGGSLQENITIQQITQSLLKLETVNRVHFLIDGAESETLMGHYDIMYPFEN